MAEVYGLLNVVLIFLFWLRQPVTVEAHVHNSFRVYVEVHCNGSCRRAAATTCPRPYPPSVGAEAPRAAEPTAPADDKVAVGSHGQYVPTLTAAAA